jgi:hypothetical protein
MYLVELKLGREELYRTGDELAIAIRDGDVDARSRIYHRATAKWISITLHPQYKAIVAGQTDEQLSRPARKAWGLLPASLTGLPEELSPSEPGPATSALRHRWKRPMGFGSAGVLLLLGVQLAFSGPRPPWSGRGKAVAVTRQQDHRVARADIAVKPRQLAELVSFASSSDWAVSAKAEPAAIALPTPVARPARALPRAPRLRTKALHAALAFGDSAEKKEVKANTVQALLRRYEAVSDEVRARLESGMRVSRLNQLFASARLMPGGGVTDTRLNLAGAANFIRIYRKQQAAIDKAYQDSVALLAKRHGWTPKDVKQWSSRPQRQDAPTLELLSGSLLSGIDSLLGVLDAQAGAYKLRGTAIAFEDPAAARAYAALRRQIKEQIDEAVAAGAATSFGPIGLLLQAIGTSTLPRET